MTRSTICACEHVDGVNDPVIDPPPPRNEPMTGSLTLPTTQPGTVDRVNDLVRDTDNVLCGSHQRVATLQVDCLFMGHNQS